MRQRSGAGRRRWARGAGALTLAGVAIIPAAPTAGAQEVPTVLCTPDVVADAAAFGDLPESSPHRAAVACLSAYGIVRGTSATTFSPNVLLRRDQAAGLLARTAGLVQQLPPGDDAFTDDTGNLFEPAINTVAALGVLEGKSPDRFDPAGSLTRGQAASIVVRSLERFLPVPDGPDAFSDDDGSVHERNINAAAALGIFEGFPDGTFGLSQPLTRAQGATAMVGTLERIAAAVREQMEVGR